MRTETVNYPNNGPCNDGCRFETEKDLMIWVAGHCGHRFLLKENLPQAFMQIGWMEDNLRNLTAKVWANLDNPIKRWFFKGFINFVYMYVALSGGTLLISVMSQQYNCLMELYFSWKCIFPLLFNILRYVRAEMNVHAFMNELDQKDYWYPTSKKILKLWKSMYKVNGELSSCDITYSGRVPSREGDIHNFA